MRYKPSIKSVARQLMFYSYRIGSLDEGNLAYHIIRPIEGSGPNR